MGTAYTPGLKVSANTAIRKIRKLPVKGEVIVKIKDKVFPHTAIARANLAGELETVRVAEILGVEAVELGHLLKVKADDTVKKGDTVAVSSFLFGMFKSSCASPVDGVIEFVSEVSGHIGIRQSPQPIEVSAYIEGEVVEIIPEEGAVIETKGAFIQGIFGVGGERQGIIKVLDKPEEPLTPDKLSNDMKGKILVGKSLVTGPALKKAEELGIAGVVVGGIIDKELIELLGYDIGVAITGHENIKVTAIVTEGFGDIKMAPRTFELFKSLEGKSASINGATQIRAGVIRPEVIVPLKVETKEKDVLEEQQLNIGTQIRVIREPYFGKLGKVLELPPELTKIESGAKVRILQAELEGGSNVSIPRANVEIIQK